MIHQYKNNGYNIVLDVNSGSVHVVDDMVYDIIGLYENILLSRLQMHLETDILFRILKRHMKRLANLRKQASSLQKIYMNHILITLRTDLQLLKRYVFT